MKSKLILPAVLLFTTAACGGRDGARSATQQQYETVQEGSAAGVTANIGGPGETLPPITGTDMDTTTALALNPNILPPGTPAPAPTSTYPPPMTSAAMPTQPAPVPRPVAPAPQPVTQSPSPVQPPPPVKAEPAEPVTDTTATTTAPAEEPPPPPAEENSEQAEEPPPPPPPV
ncbi:MAG TPA: hypothetical protein VGQ76_28260 [Thermoanaerobaculia bacterium]|nr:hypothetical protein [Thermoanaerobaculia bacterium]